MASRGADGFGPSGFVRAGSVAIILSLSLLWGAPAVSATERIIDEPSDTIDLSGAQNFGKLSLTTSEVKVGGEAKAGDGGASADQTPVSDGRETRKAGQTGGQASTGASGNAGSSAGAVTGQGGQIQGAASGTANPGSSYGFSDGSSVSGASGTGNSGASGSSGASVNSGTSGNSGSTGASGASGSSSGAVFAPPPGFGSGDAPSQPDPGSWNYPPAVKGSGATVGGANTGQSGVSPSGQTYSGPPSLGGSTQGGQHSGPPSLGGQPANGEQGGQQPSGNSTGTGLGNVKNNLPSGPSPQDTSEDLMSKLIPDETFEIIGSSAAANPKAEEYFKNGTELFNNKRYAEAKGFFDMAVDLEPKNDVYILALEMVINTMKAQNIKIPEKKSAPADAYQAAPLQGQQATAPNVPVVADPKSPKGGEAAKNGTGGKDPAKVPETSVTQAAQTKQPAKPVKKYVVRPRVRTQVFTCSFVDGQPVGNIVFNLGLNTEVRKSDAYGNYIWFDAEKDAMALAAFRLDCQPKKAMLIITQRLMADDNNFKFPLTVKVNHAEAMNGVFRMATDYKPYQWDITDTLHPGYNQIVFQTEPTITSNYAMLRIEIFVQNY